MVVLEFFKRIWISISDFFSTNGEKIILAFLVLVIGHYLIIGILAILRKIVDVRKRQKTRDGKTFLMSFINIILRLVLCASVLKILSIPLNNFVTIFSAAVLAVGLALQDSIGNFASGVMILSTKQFAIGDYVELEGGSGGTVSEIRMMTTTFNTPNNQKLIIPNSQIMKCKITNYSAYPTRRIDFVVSISVISDVILAKKVILEILLKNKAILKDPSPKVMVKSISGSSVDIGVRGFTDNSDYWETFWAINETIVLAFNQKGINIPLNRVEVSLTNNGTTDINLDEK